MGQFNPIMSVSSYFSENVKDIGEFDNVVICNNVVILCRNNVVICNNVIICNSIIICNNVGLPNLFEWQFLFA